MNLKNTNIALDSKGSKMWIRHFAKFAQLSNKLK